MSFRISLINEVTDSADEFDPDSLVFEFLVVFDLDDSLDVVILLVDRVSLIGEVPIVGLSFFPALLVFQFDLNGRSA